MDNPSVDRDPVEVLAAEFAERLRRGEVPSVTEYVSRHPDLSDEIRELFPTIAAMERMKTRRWSPGSGEATLDAPPPERLGDFRILRQIGRGGMGIVFEAEQESLRRPVAVKVMPKLSLLEPKHLKRFQREAQTAAKLHHSNIVPVFGVGHDDGFHYIVMQRIRGVGLDGVLARLAGEALDAQSQPRRTPDAGRLAAVARALIAEKFPHSAKAGKTNNERNDTKPLADDTGPPVPPTLPHREPRVDNAGRWNTGSFWHGIASIGIQAAEAMAYAHAQGVLHRDIKPANLLIDEPGVVWITDFGLAKATDDEVSRTGDVVGTLRYMAPEQFRGECNTKSDIYSLGLTLYELATLKPAFDSSDPSTLMRKVAEGNTPAPRRLQPEIPRDLETIVLKSIACTPSDRYPSAGDLAADLRAFLEDRPIQARRVTPVERLWRWGRRNPLVAGLTSTVLVLLLVVAIVSSVGYVQASRAGTRATKATAQAVRAFQGEKKQRQKAEATTAVALEVLDRIYTRLAPGDLVGTSQISVEASDGDEIEIPLQPVLSDQTVALLEELLAFYDRLAVENADNQQLREDTATAYRRVGTIKRHLGQMEDADAAYRHALEIYQKLDAGASDHTEFRTEMAVIHNELGNIHAAQSKKDKAREEHGKALSILESGSSTSSYLPAEDRYELARTYYHLGTTGRPGPERSAAPPMNPPGDEPGPRGRGRRPPDQGAGPAERGPGHPPPDSARRPPPRRRPPPGSRPPGPPDIGARHHPPGSDPDRMIVDEGLSRLEATPERRHYVDSAIEILEELLREHPSEAKYRHLLARCYRDSPPDVLSAEGPFLRLNKATRILEALVEEYPGVAGYRFDLIESYAAPQLCGPLLTPEICPVVEERLRTALELSEELVAEHPNIPAYEASRVQIYLKLADVLHRTDRPAEAESNLRTGLDVQLSLVKAFPKALSYKVWLATIQRSLAMLLRDQNQLPDAQTLLEESISVLEPLRENQRELPYVRPLLAESYLALGDVLSRMGQHEQAHDAQQAARELRPGRRGPPSQPKD
jgi:tetratricopeptide (TPR) repeat protein